MLRFHKRLKYVLIFFSFLFALNALEYYVLKGRDMRVVKGRVSSVDTEMRAGSTYKTRNIFYYRTTIFLDEGRRSFHITATSGVDENLASLRQGDEVEIFTRQLYHYLTFLETGGNMFRVKKDGQTIFDVTYLCRASNGTLTLVSGIAMLFLLVIYLDVVKHISLENWFQKRIMKNPDYINGKKDKDDTDNEEKFFID